MIHRKTLNRLAYYFLSCLFAAALAGCASLGKPGCDTESSHAAECAATTGTTADYLYPAPILTPLQSYEVPALPIKLPTIDLTRETDDIFQRIRKGFSMPDINNDLVLEHQQRYLIDQTICAAWSNAARLTYITSSMKSTVIINN